MIRTLAAGSLLAAILHGMHLAGPSPLPDPARTPGAVNPGVTRVRIGETICRRRWTRTVRPPERYTEELKRRQIREYGYADPRLRGDRLGDYEEDHLIPLELGGAPADPRNLWPEPRRAPGVGLQPAVGLQPPGVTRWLIRGWGSRRKDRLEYRLNRLVRSGRLPLAEAQRAIARNWVAAYRKYAARAR